MFDSAPTANALTCNAPGQFAVTVLAEDAQRCRLAVAGELDLGSARRLVAELDRQLAAGRRFVSIDLSELSFTDSTGVGVLLATHERLLARRGTLILSGVGQPVERMLQLTGLDGVLFIATPIERMAAAANA